MTDNIVPINSSQFSSSPFDSIRQFDDRGEFWSARDLQTVLGYSEWRKFSDSIDRAKAALEAAGQKAFNHIVPSAKKVELGSGAIREVVDHRMTRMGCYMTAMNGDPRKPEIAAAQSYFAVKTREAEVVIPEQSARMQELEAENRNMELKLKVYEAQQKTLSAAGMLALSAPALAEAILLPGVTIIEKTENIDRTVIVDTQGNVVSQFDGVGITAIQKQFGFKSTKAAWDWLESIGYGKDSPHWRMEPTALQTKKLDRSVLTELKKRFAQRKGSRQRLIGE